MAERFQVPPKFTKKWWQYFWEYYKWYVIVALCIVLAVTYTVYQVANKPKHILNITYAGSSYFPEEVADAFISQLEEGISTPEDDGIFFSQLNFDDSENADIQFQSALIQRLSLEFITDETMLFLFDKAKLDDVLASESSDGIFVPAEVWAETETDDVYSEVAVCLKDSKIINEHNINGEDLYVVLRHNYHPGEEETQKRFEYSRRVANKLIIE